MTDTSRTDSGWYICVASNSDGRDEAKVFMEVIPDPTKPDPVEDEEERSEESIEEEEEELIGQPIAYNRVCYTNSLVKVKARGSHQVRRSIIVGRRHQGAPCSNIKNNVADDEDTLEHVCLFVCGKGRVVTWLKSHPTTSNPEVGLYPPFQCTNH